MSTLTLTYTAVANTVAPSVQYNLNNSEIVTWSTTIDHSNTVNSTGFWASDIKPLTAGEATFGATATGVGYKYLANDATATPLTISGVSGQSAALQQWTLTSGGTVALSVDKGGALVFGSGTTALGTNVSINNDSGATNGLFINVPTGSTSGIQLGVNGSTKVQMTNAGALNVASFVSAGSGGGFALAAGDVGAARSTTTGVVRLGGSSALVGIDFNITNSLATTFLTAASAYTDIFAGLYHNASDESLKMNIAPISGSLSKIQALNPITFDWAATGKPSAGFTAQDVQSQFPDAVSADKDGTLLYAPSVVLAHLVQAFQDYVSTHP